MTQQKSQRQSWDSYFMGLAHQVATRSICQRRKVGAVAVNQRHRIIGTGYNGPPSGMAHCTKDTCVRMLKNIPSGTQVEICKAIHAEANIVLQLGSQLEDAVIYITCQPCISCLKLLMGAQVARIVWESAYPDEYARELMSEYGSVSQFPAGDANMELFELVKIQEENQ